MKYKKNMLVRHPTMTAWGDGLITSVTDRHLTVRFEGDSENKERMFLLDYNLEIVGYAGLEITKEYEEIQRLVQLGHPSIFVSGRAGTGKSELIGYLSEIIKRNIVIVAPTGMAALNVKGSTIHSFFQLPPTVVTSKDVKSQQDKQMYKSIGLLVVDEVSMVRADVFDAMDKFLRVNGKNPDKPFGGTPLLLIGDMYQLPPVVKREEREPLQHYQTPYFFSSLAYQQLEVKYIELTKTFRQKDKVFMDMLNKIRVGEGLGEVLPVLNDACCKAPAAGESVTTLTPTNEVADSINESELEKLPSEEKSYKGVTSGTFEKGGMNFPAPLVLKLKVGARVMFTKNDEQKRWVNGSMGVVRNLTKDSIQVEMGASRKGRLVEVGPVHWDRYEYKFDVREKCIKPIVVGQYTQFPLMLAWAITIHKAQGKTLDKVNIDLKKAAFATGQIYVALSRCRTLGDLSLTRGIGMNEVKFDEKIKDFYSALKTSEAGRIPS